MGRRFIFISISLVFVIALIGWLLIWMSSSIRKDGEVVIESGQAARQLWTRLTEEGFTSNTLSWRYYAWRTDAATRLQAGTYALEAGEHVKDVVNRFIRGEAIPDELTITYPEGFTIEQMAARTSNRGIGSPEEFIRTAVPANFQQRFSFLADIPSDRSLEGYLFPDTYRVSADDTPHDVIIRMLVTFDTKVTAQLRQEAEASGRTLDQIIIMASIIEREVQTDADMAKVAGVLWKRFDDGVGLDADATVRYAVNKWDEPLTINDLRIDSPYNSRRFRGLPPGPISNPGLRAILAAIRPEATDYYYYLSTPEGETIFSKTLDEHNVNKARYLQ